MLEDINLKVEIRAVYDKSRGIYGSPRISKELNCKGFKVSRSRVTRLMKEENIQSKIRKQFKVTTNSKHSYPVVSNKLNQEFQVKRANAVWVSDITYIRTNEGWLYLTTILDLWDRKIVGWALSKMMHAKSTIIPAWQMANMNRPIQDSLIFHSDRME